jgi:hypothetical protein
MYTIDSAPRAACHVSARIDMSMIMLGLVCVRACAPSSGGLPEFNDRQLRTPEEYLAMGCMNLLLAYPAGARARGLSSFYCWSFSLCVILFLELFALLQDSLRRRGEAEGVTSASSAAATSTATRQRKILPISRAMRCGNVVLFCNRHLVLKPECLPRQARDKHRKR